MRIYVEYTVFTNDGHEYYIARRTANNELVGLRVDSKSQRLFYPDGQYVGGGKNMDVRGAKK